MIVKLVVLSNAVSFFGQELCEFGSHTIKMLTNKLSKG
jgi:hypothetical protein